MVLEGTPQPIQLYGYYPASNGPNETGFTTQCTLTTTTNCIDPPQVIQAHTPNVYNITISNLTATGATSPSIIVGVPESCILNVNLNNVNITTSTAGGAGAPGTFQLRNMTGTFNNVNLTSSHSPAIAQWAVQENVQLTTTNTPGLAATVSTPPLTTTPAGAGCCRYPRGTTP
jgi:hypothetical protein